MACQKQIDDMLKKDFNISSKNILYSHRFAMINRKKELTERISNLFNSLISEKEYNNIRHLISNPLHATTSFNFENNYFDLQIVLRIEQKNILSFKYLVDIEFNQYKLTMTYNDFYTTPYKYFKQKLLSLDNYNFCFLKSKFENIVTIQQCFC